MPHPFHSISVAVRINGTASSLRIGLPPSVALQRRLTTAWGTFDRYLQPTFGFQRRAPTPRVAPDSTPTIASVSSGDPLYHARRSASADRSPSERDVFFRIRTETDRASDVSSPLPTSRARPFSPRVAKIDLALRLVTTLRALPIRDAFGQQGLQRALAGYATWPPRPSRQRNSPGTPRGSRLVNFPLRFRRLRLTPAACQLLPHTTTREHTREQPVLRERSNSDPQRNRSRWKTMTQGVVRTATPDHRLPVPAVASPCPRRLGNLRSGGSA